MPPNQQNPYDFILNNNQPSRSPLGGNSMAVRIAVVVGGLVLLIIIAVVISSFLGGSDKAQNQRLLEITQSQGEIIRVSALATDQKTKSTEARVLAANTRIATTSSQQKTKQLLAKRGIGDKAVTKQLGAGKNPKNDAALDEATKNNRFDETLTALLNTQLTSYQKLVQAAYENGTPSEQKILKSEFENAKLLTAKTITSQ